MLQDIVKFNPATCEGLPKSVYDLNMPKHVGQRTYDLALQNCKPLTAGEQNELAFYLSASPEQLQKADTDLRYKIYLDNFLKVGGLILLPVVITITTAFIMKHFVVKAEKKLKIYKSLSEDENELLESGNTD